MLSTWVLCALGLLWQHGAATEIIVHLMDWRFDDIATECETFLSKNGYSAVLVSPVHEPPRMLDMPWYERYQVFSYNITSRSGNDTDFQSMAQRCSKAGVKVYVEVVLNHMSTNLPLGTEGLAGSKATAYNKEYPALSFSAEHFHPTCQVVDYFNTSNVRKCELDYHHDLYQKHEHVRKKQAEFLNRLIDLGAKGFKLCNAKYMYPDDLEIIVSRVKKLPSGQNVFVFSDVSITGTREAVSPEEYANIGAVTEYKFERYMKSVSLFERQSNISTLANYSSNLMNSSNAVINMDFMDVKNVWDIGLRKFKVYVTFMLAQPYGAYKTILSSYWMNNNKQPPHYDNQTIRHVEFKDGTCEIPWNCEHRWPLVRRMSMFSQIVEGTNMTNFTIHSSTNFTQISFCRGAKGFIAISDTGYSRASIKAQTCLPAGRYCNIVSGSYTNKAGKKACMYTEVQVAKNGIAMVTFTPQEDGIVALHIMERANNGALRLDSLISICLSVLIIYMNFPQ